MRQRLLGLLRQEAGGLHFAFSTLSEDDRKGREWEKNLNV
jgi:hypothetical protein